MTLRTRQMAAVVVILAIMAAVTVYTVQDASSEASATSKTAKTVTTIVEAKAGQKCEGGYAVKLFGNTGKKLDDAHEARIKALRAKYDGAVLEAKVRDMHLRMAKRDPRFLWLVLKSSKLDGATGVKSVEELSKGGCYTYKGRTAYAVLKGALYAATKVDPAAEAGTNWVNTGVGSDGKVFQTAPGISGNRHGTLYVLPNGTIFVVMDRCGNVTTPGPMHGVPPEAPPQNPCCATTPQQPPATVPTTVCEQQCSTTTTVPGTGGKHDNHPVGNPLPGGAGGPQAGNTDTTPDNQDPDGTHVGSDTDTGCHGTCTGGTPATTRPAPPSTVETNPVTVPATVVATTAPGP